MSDYGPELMAKMEAAEQMETKQRILGYYQIFRHDYIGGTPEPLVTAKTPRYSIYKCRKSFFLTILRYANQLVSEGIITSQEAATKCAEFKNFYETAIQKKSNTDRITLEDIQKADNFLDYSINQLSK